LRSLVFTDKPDFMIGNSYGKFIQRDTLHKGKAYGVPLIRIGFPIFNRLHLHRMTTLVNAVLDRLDEETWQMSVTDYNYDLIRRSSRYLIPTYILAAFEMTLNVNPPWNH